MGVAVNVTEVLSHIVEPGLGEMETEGTTWALTVKAAEAFAPVLPS